MDGVLLMVVIMVFLEVLFKEKFVVYIIYIYISMWNNNKIIISVKEDLKFNWSLYFVNIFI